MFSREVGAVIEHKYSTISGLITGSRPEYVVEDSPIQPYESLRIVRPEAPKAPFFEARVEDNTFIIDIEGKSTDNPRTDPVIYQLFSSMNEFVNNVVGTEILKARTEYLVGAAETLEEKPETHERIVVSPTSKQLRFKGGYEEVDEVIIDTGYRQKQRKNILKNFGMDLGDEYGIMQSVLENMDQDEVSLPELYRAMIDQFQSMFSSEMLNDPKMMRKVTENMLTLRERIQNFANMYNLGIKLMELDDILVENDTIYRYFHNELVKHGFKPNITAIEKEEVNPRQEVFLKQALERQEERKFADKLLDIHLDFKTDKDWDAFMAGDVKPEGFRWFVKHRSRLHQIPLPFMASIEHNQEEMMRAIFGLSMSDITGYNFFDYVYNPQGQRSWDGYYTAPILAFNFISPVVGSIVLSSREEGQWHIKMQMRPWEEDHSRPNDEKIGKRPALDRLIDETREKDGLW